VRLPRHRRIRVRRGGSGVDALLPLGLQLRLHLLQGAFARVAELVGAFRVLVVVLGVVTEVVGAVLPLAAVAVSITGVTVALVRSVRVPVGVAAGMQAGRTRGPRERVEAEAGADDQLQGDTGGLHERLSLREVGPRPVAGRGFWA